MTAEPIKNRKRTGRGGKSAVDVPRISLRQEAMTVVLKALKRKDPDKWKYDYVTEIPKSKLRDFAKALVRKYGLTRAKRMVNYMIIVRKNATDKATVEKRKWFEELYSILEGMSE